MQNIYASCVKVTNKGLLILGASGSGKSDLCLRLILEKGAKLIADDRTDIWSKKGKLYAKAPQNLYGKLEVRGQGIISVPAQKQCQIQQVIELVDGFDKVERMPLPEYKDFEGVSVIKHKLYAFEASAVDKVISLLIY